MDWITVIWSAAAGACLILGLTQFVVWCGRKQAWENLWFSVTTIGVIGLIVRSQARWIQYLAFIGVSLYSLLGFIAALFNLAIYALIPVTLTLPGIAGFILSVGMAVDANVLIFERIREELDHGKSNRLAIDEGFRHAMSAIIDTSATTILSGMVLYQYGTGPVRGFAVTLIAGLVASLFTSIFVSKTFFMIWLSRTRGNQTLSI